MACHAIIKRARKITNSEIRPDLTINAFTPFRLAFASSYRGGSNTQKSNKIVRVVLANGNWSVIGYRYEGNHLLLSSGYDYPSGVQSAPRRPSPGKQKPQACKPRTGPEALWLELAAGVFYTHGVAGNLT